MCGLKVTTRMCLGLNWPTIVRLMLKYIKGRIIVMTHGAVFARGTIIGCEFGMQGPSNMRWRHTVKEMNSLLQMKLAIKIRQPFSCIVLTTSL